MHLNESTFQWRCYNTWYCVRFPLPKVTFVNIIISSQSFVSAHVSTYACNHVLYRILNIDWLIDMKDINYNYAFAESPICSERSCLYVSLTTPYGGGYFATRSSQVYYCVVLLHIPLFQGNKEGGVQIYIKRLKWKEDGNVEDAFLDFQCKIS